jgi:hypothetical protein
MEERQRCKGTRMATTNLYDATNAHGSCSVNDRSFDSWTEKKEENGTSRNTKSSKMGRTILVVLKLVLLALSVVFSAMVTFDVRAAEEACANFQGGLRDLTYRSEGKDNSKACLICDSPYEQTTIFHMTIV